MILSTFARTVLCISVLYSVYAYPSEYFPEQIRLSQWYSPTTMAVMWQTNQSTPNSYILYHRGKCKDEIFQSNFKAVGAGSYQYKGYAGFIHLGFIEGLNMDDSYCYQVGDSTYGYSAAREFVTPASDRVTIAAWGDTGTYGNIEKAMPALTMDTEPSLVLHVGDLSYAQTDDVWDKWYRMVEPVASTRPYMVIPGNWDVKPFAIEGFLNRNSMPLAPLKHMSNAQWAAYRPVGEQPLYYYSFPYGPVHVVMLSSYDTYEAGSAQYQWFEEDLARASKSRSVRPWIVVCFHSPMYSSSTGHNGSDLKFRAAMEALLKRYKVDLTLTGHDHGYERTFPVYDDVILHHGATHYENPEGTIHILAGTGGANADPWLPQPEWSAVREGTWGYTKISASLISSSTSSSSSCSLHVKYLRANGTVGDEFIIYKDRISVSAIEGIHPGALIGLFVAFCVLLPYFMYRRGCGPRSFFRSRSAQPSPGTPGAWRDKGLV